MDLASPSNKLELPPAPSALTGRVKAWRQPISILTYLPDAPDQNPMFLENRVYQGSSGRVYPLPYYDRIAQEPVLREWDAIHLENEYVRLMILPEIGGRIHIGYDKISGYDFFYRQNVIKPALVGLAGPWTSGGVEFNWPQHHRPATFMPVSASIEEHADGGLTVWCADNDPMLRMTGVHGIRLHPGRAVVEVNVRLYNRTPLTQTFLWWANAAVRVHEHYQSFFPSDVLSVADHAKRAVTSYPRSDRPYYGVDYPGRFSRGVPLDELPTDFPAGKAYPPDDLSWYANIPVPTSYMAVGSSQDFFGGYDHAARAGVVHVANHHIAPGKKQWTWGNPDFGYAWGAHLTDADGPYIELMAGVYTDNQPDFSYLAPWETKTFRQTWYALRDIGVPVQANEDLAMNVQLTGQTLSVALSATRAFLSLTVRVLHGIVELFCWEESVRVERVALFTGDVERGIVLNDLSIMVEEDGKRVAGYEPGKMEPAAPNDVAREPLSPEKIDTVEELILTGTHLAQYRHATRAPEPYWKEALRRDPENSGAQNAMGLWHLRRGEFALSSACFQTAIRRLTCLNPNPTDGEPYYNLGLAERFLGNLQKAYDAFYKATWNAAWKSAAYFALAEMDTAAERWQSASEHLHQSLRSDSENLNAIYLLACVQQKLGNAVKSRTSLEKIAERHAFHAGLRWANGLAPERGQELLDLAFDLVRCGMLSEAEALLGRTAVEPVEGAQPIALLLRASILRRLGHAAQAQSEYQCALKAPIAYCFPGRLEEMLLLKETIDTHPDDAMPKYLLGLLLYDRGRYDEAIALWEKAAQLGLKSATLWRNLGIAYFNHTQDSLGARAAFDQAIALNPADTRIVYERDQLWKRLREHPRSRLRELLRFPLAIAHRDDLSLEVASLYNQLDRPEEALRILSGRDFQPWEGGEGLVMAEFVRAQLLLGQQLLTAGQPSAALAHLLSALDPPASLGEANHLLANHSDVYFWLGIAYGALDEPAQHAEWLERAGRQQGDFKEMSIRSISELTLWSALALRQLGRVSHADELLHCILRYADELDDAVATVDYFATSLPTMLVFNEDLAVKKRKTAQLLRSEALLALGKVDKAKALLDALLKLDPSYGAAADLLRCQLPQAVLRC